MLLTVPTILRNGMECLVPILQNGSKTGFDSHLVLNKVFATLQLICEMTRDGISADSDPLNLVIHL